MPTLSYPNRRFVTVLSSQESDLKNNQFNPFPSHHNFCLRIYLFESSDLFNHLFFPDLFSTLTGILIDTIHTLNSQSWLHLLTNSRPLAQYVEFPTILPPHHPPSPGVWDCF